MSEVKCFLIEPTGMVRLYLRRYQKSGTEYGCGRLGDDSALTYHNAESPYETVPEAKVVDKRRYRPAANDPRWPTHCECGYRFKTDDEWQVFPDDIYVRKDTDEEMTLRTAPPGAMWFMTWLEPYPAHCGPDGRAICVRLPDGHDWHIDARASNCTMKDDNEHQCWVRHGDPPLITVDKNGKTCEAGAGSIQTPTWHGFLKNGVLVR